MSDPFNCPKCGAHDYGLFAASLVGCPHCNEMELTALRARVAELEREKQTLRTMHLKMCEIAEERYHKLAAAERDAARWLKSATEICDQFCGKRYHGACISTDCPRRVKVDAAMAPRGGGEGGRNG